ncbi:Myotubularin- protein 14 [Mortierella sp. GBA30]|nr:Myotubularin- protein 14 [Mortierella sp. GBA30]
MPSGWDRTPLFISLLRISLWADGEAHQSLTAAEMLYLTMGYDWFLFNHLLSDRSQRGEDIFYFCFYFLKFIYGDEFSLKSVSELCKKNKSTCQSSSRPTSSPSPLLKNIGRLRNLENALTSPEPFDPSGYICEDCRLSRKSPCETLGREASSVRNSSQDVASSTDGKPSSWQLVTFSTPPGRDRHGSPRAPFFVTQQTLSKGTGTGSPRGAKRSSLSTGFIETLDGQESIATATIGDEDLSKAECRHSTTSPCGLTDGRFRLGLPPINARRSSSSNIPELAGDESRHQPARTNTGIGFIPVNPLSELLGGRHPEDKKVAMESNNKGDGIVGKPTTPRKRASTFDGGLLFNAAQESQPGSETLDRKGPEDDLTSSDDDSGEAGISGSKDDHALSSKGQPATSVAPSKPASPQICQVCHQSFITGSNQQQAYSLAGPVGSGSATPLGPGPSSIPDHSDTRSNPSQQQPMNISAKQALERMRNIDRLFAQEDAEPFDNSYHHHHHHAHQHVNESDREEGMFQLEIEDHRSSYRKEDFSMCDKIAGEAVCLDEPNTHCHDSLDSSICAEQDMSSRSTSLAPANETESIDGENESFWEETSTVDYGCSPGSILNGFGLGLTKYHADGAGDDLSLATDGSLGSHADGSFQNEEDDDDDDDDDEAASLNSRQSSLKMECHENEHLFMPSLKGVFSSAHRPSHGREAGKEGSNHNDGTFGICCGIKGLDDRRIYKQGFGPECEYTGAKNNINQEAKVETAATPLYGNSGRDRGRIPNAEPGA